MVNGEDLKKTGDEKEAIAEHHEDKVSQLRSRFFIETLAFMGVTIGFTLSLYNVWRTHTQIQSQIKTLD